MGGELDESQCNHVIIQSFHHHEDASLALWALFLQSTQFARMSVERSFNLLAGTVISILSLLLILSHPLPQI